MTQQIISLIFFMITFLSLDTVQALELDEPTRTVQLEASGKTIVLTPELSLATPSRDHINGLVNYMKDPTTYDGEYSIAELHPSIKSAEIFPKMRNLTDEDLFAIAGHILVQPKIASEKWGGGKIYY